MKRYFNMYKKSHYLLLIGFLLGLSSYGQTYLQNFNNVGENFVTVNEHSYFFAQTVSDGWGLWKTDGTQKGTNLIKKMDSNDHYSSLLYVYNDEVYFSSYDQSYGQELWKTDGSDSGTNLLKDINPNEGWGVLVSNFNIYEGFLYFNVRIQNSHDIRTFMYRTDGTNEGTVLADDIIEEGVGVIAAVANDKLYFLKDEQLYETNGTSAGTQSVVVDGLQYMSGFQSFSSGLYFITYNHNKTYIRLYKLTDIDNYIMIREFSTTSYSGLELYNLAEINGSIVFSLGSGSAYNDVKDALWKTDGTPEGTTELISFGNNNLYDSGNFKGFVEYEGSLYFNAGPATNSALWKTDGTQQGTIVVIPEAGINEYAPMLVLDGNLYFQRSSTLHMYDNSAEESTPVFPLQNARKSSGDSFFIKSDGRYIYVVVKNEREKDSYTFDLFHSGANPLMKVSTQWNVLNEDTIKFESKVDSVVVKEINIQNLGNAPLAFSKIFVSGEGFYVNGDIDVNWYQGESQTYFPQRIDPENRGRFEIGFLPQSSGVYTGYLIIRGNDIAQPEFRIKLEGVASDIPPISLNGTFPLNKEINWENMDSTIQIDNGIISENAIIGTVIGAFSTNGSSNGYTYELIEGIGSEDNSIFTIENNNLLIGDGFQANNSKAYTIRVASMDIEGTMLEESIILGVTEVSEEVQLGVCDKIAIPLTSDLIAVDFINDTDAIAVGAKGVILKTQDKGMSWQHLNVVERTIPSGGLYPYPARLTDVYFVDDTTGFITGDNVLLRTDDAGLSWKPLRMNNIPLYDQYRFMALNSEILFLFIDNYLYKSTDGGQTWLNPLYIGLHDNRSVYFYNDTLGFVSDTWEEYAITKDGGISWTKYELTLEELSYDEDITGFTFIDELLGYAATSKGKVLKSVDGGENWIIVNSEPRNGVNEIHFFDENRGYMVNGSMYETIDGGVTWTSVQTSTCSHLNGIATNGLGDQIAVGSGCYSNGRSIYIAPSGGPWAEISSIYGTADVRNIIFSDQQAYLFSSSQSRKSYDGGITWKELITPIDGQITFAEDLGNALLIKYWNGPFYRSTDNGLNWEVLGGGTSFGKFDILDQSTIIAFNADGNQLSKSIDGGVNWDPILGETLYQNNVVEFVNETTGFIGGFPNISRTTDGGASWEVLTLDPNESISVYAITFVSEQIGMISTTDGYYKTIDGGDSWVKLSLQIAQTNEILAVSELEWHLASDRYIYSTYDGGATWELYFSNNDKILDLDIVDGKFYISDDDGAVSRIDDDIPPLNAGYISGDLAVRRGTEEIYTVLKHSDNKYAWEVTGGQNLVFEDNFARIIWDTPGEYTLKVIPHSTCQTGSASEIMVTVYGDMLPPEISGPIEVVENSQGVVYSTPDEAQVRYLWSVTGQQSFQVDGNSLIVDWGGIGQQEIGLIKTDLISGMQVYNSLLINVVPLDPFTILQQDASCRGTANGSLQITSRLPEVTYTANLESTGYSLSQQFSGELLLENLASGIYDVCITEIDTDKSNCYQITVSEPEPFEVTAKTGSLSTKKVNLVFKGGIAPYTVLLNGRQVAETSQSKLQLTAENGDLLEVLSSGNCAFSYSEKIVFPGVVRISPNPVINSFDAVLGDEFPIEMEEVPVQIFDTAGQLALVQTVKLSNGTLTCDISILTSGLYLVVVGDELKTSFKILKK